MGWELIPWYTLPDKFDADFGVDQWHGHNAFIHDGAKIYRTVFDQWAGRRGHGHTLELPRHGGAGRQETWEDSPEGYPQTELYKWQNWHDNYLPDGKVRSRMGQGVFRRCASLQARRVRQVMNREVDCYCGDSAPNYCGSRLWVAARRRAAARLRPPATLHGVVFDIFGESHGDRPHSDTPCLRHYAREAVAAISWRARND